MNKIKFVLPLMLIILSQSGCIYFGDSSVNYKTPELFLEKIVYEQQTKLYSSAFEIPEYTFVEDTEFTIKNAILEAKPFEEIEKFKVNKEIRYSTYYQLISNATTGPNYAQMFIYDDGKLIVNHKATLGSHKYYYYSFDEKKAVEINDLILQKITDSIDKNN